MTPRLTIVIPTINRARLVARAIESALAQTSPEVEIIVSDNGSTDNTPEVIRRYAGKGLRTFRRETTIPVTEHTKFLQPLIRTEFMVPLSDDDYLEPTFAAKVLALYDEHPELSFVYTGCAVHYEDCEVPAVVGPPVENGIEFLAQHYAGKREVSWCACVIRTNDLQLLGPQPPDRIIGDMFFWTKMAMRGPVGCVPEVLSHYILLRQQNDNMSHGTSPFVWAREVRLLADEVIEGAERAGTSAEFLARLRVDCRNYVSRSAANQFVWTRIRGAGLAKTWGSVASCARYVGANPMAWARLGAALMIPRKALKRLLLDSAVRLADARRSKDYAANRATAARNLPIPACSPKGIESYPKPSQGPAA